MFYLAHFFSATWYLDKKEKVRRKILFNIKFELLVKMKLYAFFKLLMRLIKLFVTSLN